MDRSVLSKLVSLMESGVGLIINGSRLQRSVEVTGEAQLIEVTERQWIEVTDRSVDRGHGKVSI